MMAFYLAIPDFLRWLAQLLVVERIVRGSDAEEVGGQWLVVVFLTAFVTSLVMIFGVKWLWKSKRVMNSWKGIRTFMFVLLGSIPAVACTGIYFFFTTSRFRDLASLPAGLFLTILLYGVFAVGCDFARWSEDYRLPSRK